MNSVRHQRADVPYGMFLSGGIDHRLFGLYEELNDRPVRLYSFHWD